MYFWFVCVSFFYEIVDGERTRGDGGGGGGGRAEGVSVFYRFVEILGWRDILYKLYNV